MHGAGAVTRRSAIGSPGTIAPMVLPGELWRVAAVRSANSADFGTAAPPEIAERFEGRVFTLLDLEQRGVRIAGARAMYTGNGRDWQLELVSVPPR